MSDRFQRPRLDSIDMRMEDIYLFSTPNHPLVMARKVYPKDLADQTLLLTESGCCYRTVLEEQLASAKVTPQNVSEFSSIEAIKQCVTAGMGIGFLSKMVCLMKAGFA